ncbi:hypothetical protein EBZ80_17970 [bacterium]|nr:hypothetical protein [bacterium]
MSLQEQLDQERYLLQQCGQYWPDMIALRLFLLSDDEDPELSDLDLRLFRTVIADDVNAQVIGALGNDKRVWSEWVWRLRPRYRDARMPPPFLARRLTQRQIQQIAQGRQGERTPPPLVPLPVVTPSKQNNQQQQQQQG